MRFAGLLLIGAATAASAGVSCLATPTASAQLSHGAASHLAGSAGVAGGLPATPSSVTEQVGSGPFAGMQITVNQTENLLNQAVSVSWKGAPPTYSSEPGTFVGNDYAANYVQLLQCWSTSATVAPRPEQCEYGGENSNQGAYPVLGLTHTYERVVSAPGWANFDSESQTAAADPKCSDPSCIAFVDPNSGLILDPFYAVDGTVDPSVVDYNYANFIPYRSFDTSTYFNFTTTNEVNFARTFSDGTGNSLFQVENGLQAPGLGCGQQSLPNGQVPQCWLVLVPRGTPAQENLGGDPDQTSVDTSPLTSTAWANRVTVPLSFDPVNSVCSISAKPFYVQGGEPAQPAAASWQPALCSAKGGGTYDYESGPEDNARLSVLGSASGGAGLGVVEQPIDPSQVSPDDPVSYVPLTISGIAIAFNVERVPALGTNGQPLADQVPLAGSRVASVNLTPRLVAKLLTASYSDQFYSYNAAKPPKGYSWVAANPASLLSDPDFLQYNPEFAELQAVEQWDNGSLIVESPNSDSAYHLWQWILSDPAASSWMSGKADPWGMKVNPSYSTNASINPTRTAFDSAPINSLPKDDPYCWTPPAGPDFAVLNGQVARQLCFLDWSPYAASTQNAAQEALAANDGGKATFNRGVIDPNAAWGADGPQVVGQNFEMALTDTPSADRYGLQTASLSAAGDDGPNPNFVAPSSFSLLTGALSAKSSSSSNVTTPNPSPTTPGAYPLTVVTYAAVAPKGLPLAERAAYSKFLSYAATTGQQPGSLEGQLPAGYVPLPPAMAKQTQALSASVLNPPNTPTPPTTTQTSPPATTSAAQSGSPSNGSGGADVSSSEPGDSSSSSASAPAAQTQPSSSTPQPATPVGLNPSAGLVDERVKTPGAAISAIRWMVPITGALALAAIIGVPLVVGFRRRRVVVKDEAGKEARVFRLW